MADIKTKSRKQKHRDPLPKHFKSIDEAAEFWDTHDSADYNEYFTKVEVEVNLKRTHSVEIDRNLFNQVCAIAKRKRMPADRLVKRWIEEKVRTAA